MAVAIRALRFLPKTTRVSWPLSAIIPILTLMVFIGPVVAGIAGTFLPAFGYHPILGGEGFSLSPWFSFFSEPGVFNAILISVTVGFGSTFLALMIAISIVITFYDHRLLLAIRRGLAPVLSIPHTGFAIGCAFLIAPSGWLFRLVSPHISGWQHPPDILLLQDPAGISLLVILAVKEVFFLLLMIFSALPQLNVKALLRAARSMGYSPVMTWLKVILPALYPQIRLPVYVVLVTGLSTVDIALIVGPSSPPTLSILLLNWFQDFNLEKQFTAAAGAVVQLLLVFACIFTWYCGEKILSSITRKWLVDGQRSSKVLSVCFRSTGLVSTLIVYLMSFLSLAVMVLWAFTNVWRWPSAFPEMLTLNNISNSIALLGQPLLDTFTIGLIVSVIALVLVIGCLEHEEHSGKRLKKQGFWLLYLPLLLPQIGFLFGVQILWLALSIDGGYIAVTWTHLLFVLPFTYLSMADAYRNIDPRIIHVARSLGAPVLKVLFFVKLPLLLRPVLAALAIGFSVSVAQYLPTLFAGSGRIVTLTTEAVGLSSGADRRLLGVLVFLQALLPLIVFIAATTIPSWFARKRRGLSL